jgi:hypothetical protein
MALMLGGWGAACAQAVGTVVQAVGNARIAGQPANLGNVVQAGQPLTTGEASYLYIKTTDGGFLILRPGSTAQVIAYQVDAANPANSQFKLELSQGVARSISGSAVKNARQSFRFNTPVAAIGVRGTDFTVYTDDQTTRVSVLTGGVVVSGFGGGCLPQGNGPCEGANKRELFAGQAGQILQVLRGQASPQILNASPLAPDLTAPPRPDEPPKPVASATAPVSVPVPAPIAALPLGSAPLEPNLAQVKLVALDTLTPRVTATNTVPVVAPLPVAVVVTQTVPAEVPLPVPVVVVQPAPVVVVPPTPLVPALVWGRWQALADSPATTDLPAIMSAGRLVGANSYYALARSTGTPWESPASGGVSFSLDSAQALVRTDGTGAAAAAAVQNASLSVNFAASSFATRLDLLAQNKTTTLTAEGSVGKDGLFGNGTQFAPGSSMMVQGALASHGAGTRAAYLFQSRLDGATTAYGVTSWIK